MKIEDSQKNILQIGSFFHQHRLEQKLALETVADELSLSSPEEVQAFEEGRRAISLEDIFVLTNLYNISPDEVVRLLYEVSLGLASGAPAPDLKISSGS